MVFLRARFYDPSIGRFLTKDPFPGYPSLPSTLHTYTYAMDNPVYLVDPSGQNPLVIAAVLGGLIGGIGGAILHALANPCESLGDMLTSGEFWRDVGVGALSGALAGLVGAFMPQLLPALGLNVQAGILAAVFGGALTGSVVSGTVTNLLTGQAWYAGLGSAILGGAVIGGIAGGLGYGVGKVLQGLKSNTSSVASTTLPNLDGIVRDAFEGIPIARTLPPGTILYRAELSDQPVGRWFGTQLTRTLARADRWWNILKWGSRDTISAYKLTESVTVYYGKFAGGKGTQIFIPKEIAPEIGSIVRKVAAWTLQ